MGALPEQMPRDRVMQQVLLDTARQILDGRPWHETLGLRYEELGEIGRDASVKAVLSFNVGSGVLYSESSSLLAPIFVMLKGLLGVVQGVAAERQELLELVVYCVSISRGLVEAAKTGPVPAAIAMDPGNFKTEIEDVVKFAVPYSAQKRFLRRGTAFNFRRHSAITARLKHRLAAWLDMALVRLVLLSADRSAEEVRSIVHHVVHAAVPRGVPVLPAATYVENPALVEGVVADLIDRQRPAFATHCLAGARGVGKTVLASAVVRDKRVRASFKHGIFWVPVGQEGKDNVALLLEYLARELAAAPMVVPHNWPPRFDGAKHAILHLSRIREQNDLRILVVLDDVWEIEVVNVFVRTGFHLLVTTRLQDLIPREYFGVCTIVGRVSERQGMEILRRASQTPGPLPQAEALQVRSGVSFRIKIIELS